MARASAILPPLVYADRRFGADALAVCFAARLAGLRDVDRLAGFDDFLEPAGAAERSPMAFDAGLERLHQIEHLGFRLDVRLDA